MIEMPTIKEFTEEAFAYFFCELKNLEKVTTIKPQEKNVEKVGVITAEHKTNFELAENKFQ